MRLFKTLLLSAFSAATLWAGGLDGVFDAGWTTAYQTQDSITNMHKRLQDLGMTEVVLQYAAVEKTHLYYPSDLDFLQNTQYKNNQLFPKSIQAAKEAGTTLWLGLYYNGENWYTPPTVTELDTLAERNIKVLDELFNLYGTETVIQGVYIPQEIARYYWDGLQSYATIEGLASHFLTPITKHAQSKGWKVMVAPFYNQNLETPEKLSGFFKSLFEAGFKPDVVAVQDGIGANDNGNTHADISNVGNYERAVKSACDLYGVEFWVDEELFKVSDNHALESSDRLKAQADTAKAAGAVKVIGYDLAVLGNAGLDSLKKWNSPEPASIKKIKRTPSLKGKAVRYYKLNGSAVKP